MSPSPETTSLTTATFAAVHEQRDEPAEEEPAYESSVESREEESKHVEEVQKLSPGEDFGLQIVTPPAMYRIGTPTPNEEKRGKMRADGLK